ncbi:uncharacterized protein LOC107791145 [Nicotiana tabacum]|uniref:Uncharacterized protein n=1 Tax=Nicotiana tabacum TaxID=4097 RepID=A0A1S3ZWE2_TOBAC|nr:PREDICTED: uncharacterized protein LOC107791145 [Nicotiana tabacum]XP_016468643.1 PREDICTED: uncharacterized protein LOC107791145 [Nicotiana tabacum]
MLPPDIVKQVGRPKVKRNREPDEVRKKIGQWSQSRKGTHMTCSNCGEPNHNARGCFKPNSFGNVTSCSQTQESDQPNHNERSCYKLKSTGKSSQSSKRKGASCSQTQESYAMESDQESQTDFGPFAATQEVEPYGPEVDNEEDPQLRPMVVSETQSRIERGNLRGPTTGARKIKFTGGDHIGASTPTNLPYSPTKLTWKGKTAISSSQVQLEARKRNTKMMAKKGKRKIASNDEDFL